MDFCLANKNFLELPFDKYKNDFTIYFNGKKYQINRIIADILSPNIRKMHYYDESIEHISINAKETEKVEEDYFQDFLDLPITQNKTIDMQHQIYYSEYFYLLGNYEECLNIQKNNLENINVKNAVDVLFYIIHTMDKIPPEFYYDSDPLKKVIDFISFHFVEINSESLKKLPIEIIESIVRNDSHLISNESSLLKFVIDLYNANHKNAFLFEYIWFQFVDEASMEAFFNEFNSDDMSRTLWKNLQVLYLKLKKKEYNIEYQSKGSLDIHENNDFHEDEISDNFEIYENYITLDEFVNSQLQNGTINLSGRYIPTATYFLYRISTKMTYIWEDKIAHKLLSTEFIKIENQFEKSMYIDINIESNDNSENEISFNIFWSPEMIDFFEMTEMSDVYSFAIITYYLFTGKYPFKGISTRYLVNMIRNHKRDDIPMNVPTFIKDLIEKCWNYIPKERPSFNEIAEILRNHGNQIEGIDIKLFEDAIDYYEQA